MGSGFSTEPFLLDREGVADAARTLGLRLVVLFGSCAGSGLPPGPESDIDIAVLGCPSAEFWNCFKALSRAVPDHPLDLVLLEMADPLFRHEIMRRGILLWGDPDLFCEYRAYAYRDFIDAADLFLLENTLFEKKMAYLRGQLDDSP